MINTTIKFQSRILSFEQASTRDEAQKLLDKSSKEQHNALNRKIYAKFDEIAEKKKLTSEVVKNQIKSILKKEKIIKDSLSELDFSQQEDAIKRLERILSNDNT